MQPHNKDTWKEFKILCNLHGYKYYVQEYQPEKGNPLDRWYDPLSNTYYIFATYGTAYRPVWLSVTYHNFYNIKFAYFLTRNEKTD